MIGRIKRWTRLTSLSAQQVAGRRYWIAPLLPLIWLASQALWLLLGWREQAFVPSSAQNTLIGIPLVVLAVGFGVRIIAGEMDRRTLEIAYTVPGGSHRVWISKLLAAAALLVSSEVALALVTVVLFTSYPLSALYGALQAALFYLVAAMAFAALFKSEVTGAMATVALLGINGLISGFGENPVRISPFYNPLAVENLSDADLFAAVLQNRLGVILAIAAVIALAFARAERREKLLGG